MARLRETGVEVHVNGLAVTEQDAVAGYTASIERFFGKPTIVIVDGRIPSGDGSSPYVRRTSHVFGKKRSSRHGEGKYGAKAEPSVATLMEALLRLTKAGIPVQSRGAQ